jgi:hypothetical protein
MLRNEALAIEAIMPKMTFLSSGPRIANLGSQTVEFRRHDQPHVGYLFDAIEEAGLNVTHCDIQGGGWDRLAIGPHGTWLSFAAHPSF